MESLRILVVFSGVLLVSANFTIVQQRSPEEEEHFSADFQEKVAGSDLLCKELVKNGSYFEPDMVIGVPWRIYYINMNVRNQCLDLYFRMATPLMIRRFYYDMQGHMSEQPAWGAAALMMKMGRSRRELLLFNDQGPAGKFLALANVLRDGSVPMRKIPVPLLKFQMKLIENGKYLVVTDCETGVWSVAARANQFPDRANIERAAKKLGFFFQDGIRTCVKIVDFLKSI